MKVVYEDRVIDKLIDTVLTAKRSGRIIKKILLTPEELCRFHAEENCWFNPNGPEKEMFMGIPIEEDELSGPKPKDDYDKMVLAARACGLSDEMISQIMISKQQWVRLNMLKDMMMK